MSSFLFYAAIILPANGPTDGFPEFSNRYIQQHSGKSQFPTVFNVWVVWSQRRGGCLWWTGTAVGDVLEAVGQLVGLAMQCRVIAMSIQVSAF